MYIIGRVNVNATAFPFSPLSLSVIQRHDLWLVSDFQDHPSSPGFTTGLHVVNHAEGLSLIPLNPFGLRFKGRSPRRKRRKMAGEGACLPGRLPGAHGARGSARSASCDRYEGLGKSWGPAPPRPPGRRRSHRATGETRGFPNRLCSVLQRPLRTCSAELSFGINHRLALMVTLRRLQNEYKAPLAAAVPGFVK